MLTSFTHSSTVTPMERAVPATMLIAASTDAALRSGILVSAILRHCSAVMDATLVLFGAPEALVMLAAFLIRTAAGGVLVMNEKLWSAYTVITTGMIMPISFLVRSLNSLVNAMMFTPCWPSAGPTGGAGVALPPGICSLIKPITFCAIVFTNLQPLRGQTEPIEKIFDSSHTQNTYILRSPAVLADYLKK